MPSEPSRGAYSPSEFARLAGMSITTVTEHMDTGLIPELQRLGKRRFIPADWVDRWLTTPINLAPTSGALPTVPA